MDNDSHEPDATERRIRMGCGFVAAGFLAFFCFLGDIADYPMRFLLEVVASALFFAFLAVRFGDRAWHWLVSFFSFWH